MAKNYKRECDEGRKMAADFVKRSVANPDHVGAAQHVLRGLIEQHGADSGQVAGFMTALASGAAADARDRF